MNHNMNLKLLSFASSLFLLMNFFAYYFYTLYFHEKEIRDNNKNVIHLLLLY